MRVIFASLPCVSSIRLRECLSIGVGAGTALAFSAAAAQNAQDMLAPVVVTLPDAPHLAGQPAAYLERELRAYRSGARRSEVMSIVAKTLSDDDVRDVSAYYAAMTIEVKAVPQ